MIPYRRCNVILVDALPFYQIYVFPEIKNNECDKTKDVGNDDKRGAGVKSG